MDTCQRNFILQLKAAFVNPRDFGVYFSCFLTDVINVQQSSYGGVLMRKRTDSNIALKLLLSFTAAVLIILAPRLEAHASINLTGAPRSPNTDTQVLLEWSPASGASYYELYRNGELLVERIEDTGANLSHIDGGGEILVPETSYNYQVRAYDEDGNELPAERENVSVVTTRMLQPSNLSYVYDINNGDVTIRWKNNSLAAAGTSMRLLPGTGPSREVAYVYGKAEEHILAGQNLVPGTIVEYTVLSYNEEKTRSSDPSTSIEVLPINRPSLSVSASGNMVEVSWGDYACISNFNLQRRKLSGSTWTAWQNISTSLSGTSINDTLPSGGYYDYRLIAKGSYSGEVVYRYYYDGLSVLVPPSNLKCTVADTNKIFLTWTNNSDNYSRVELQRSVNNGQFTTVERDIPKGADSYIDYDSFKENTVYRYRLVVYDEVNNSFISDECKITMSKPASPKNLQLTLVSGTRVGLSWSDFSDNEMEFRIERKTGSGRFIEIGSTKENINNYSDNGVSPGHTYTYRVRAYNYRGYSEYTNEAHIPSTALEPPNSLEVTAVSDRQINLKWTYPISGSHTTVIERKTGAQGEWKTIATTREGVTQYSNTGLSDNTEYFYRLRIHINENARSIPYPDDNSGIGAVTFIGSIRLYADAVSSNRIRLEWSSRHKGVEVVIERKTAFGDFVAIKTIESGTDRWYDEGVIPQAEYTYRIKVVDEDNESVYSNEVTVVNSYLDEPEELEVKVISKNEIKLTWVDASGSETGFEIWRYIYGYESYELYATVGPNTTSFIDDDVQEGLQYYYKIRAISSLEDITSFIVPWKLSST
jgi:chitodextrinase